MCDHYRVKENFGDFHQLKTIFKYILNEYIDDETKLSIVSVSRVEDFDIANLLSIDLNIGENYALRHASGHGYISVVQYLVEKGADIHAKDDCSLRFASLNGYLQIVKYLVEEGGADIHAGDNFSLIYASGHGHLPVVKYLIEKGANIHARNDQAVNYACKMRHFHTAEYLTGKAQ